MKSSHYYLYSAFNNANCVKAALHGWMDGWMDGWMERMTE